MIGICVPFYPWYRKHDRSEEIFDVLLKSLNDMDRQEEICLCLVNSGVRDVWGMEREFDDVAFHKRIRETWPGTVQYHTEGYFKGNRWWLGMTVQVSVEKCSCEGIFICGMDFLLPVDFVERFNTNVSKGRVWVPHAYKILQGVEPRTDYKEVGFGWGHARGLVGIMRADFFEVGGYGVEKIKDHTDSLFFNRINAKYEMTEERKEGFYHVAHPGSHASRIWHIDQVPKYREQLIAQGRKL